MQMNFHRKLPIPKEVKEEFPVSDKMAAVKAARDEDIRAARLLGKISRAAVADGDGTVLLQQQVCHRLTDEVGTTDHHAPLTCDLNTRAVEQLHHTCGGTG